MTSSLRVSRNIPPLCQARVSRHLGSRFKASGVSAEPGINQSLPCMNPRLRDSGTIATVVPLH